MSREFAAVEGPSEYQGGLPDSIAGAQVGHSSSSSSSAGAVHDDGSDDATAAAAANAARDRSSSSASSRTLAERQKQSANDKKEDADPEKQQQPQSAAAPPQEKTGPPSDPFLITPDHPLLANKPKLNPHTWKASYRWLLTAFAGLLVLNATFASSGPSGILPDMMLEYGVSQEVAILTIALFVAGYIVGPLFWGPLSEQYGRKWIFIAGFVPYVCFNVGSALAKNIGQQLVFRFIAGCFAASPLTNSGGYIADMWDADRRGIALSIFSLCPFAGPAIAPIVSGAIYVTGTNFRWLFWVMTIFGGVCTVIIILFMPETYMPYLLRREAARIRKETGDDRYHHISEDANHKPTLKETLNKTLLKPFIMFVQEPMLFILTMYLALVYGIIYLLFEALPIVFQRQHGLNALQEGLTFLSLPIGGMIGVIFYGLVINKTYMKKHHALKPKMVPPEERLKILMVAAPLLVISFFWFGWTAYSSISIWSPIIALVPLGFGILYVFLGVFNYLIDTYLMNAASALAINTVVRSAFGAGFPMFAVQMYNTLTVPGASSLLGGLLLVFLPAPFVLYKYGKRIRGWSKNAVVLD